MFGMKWVVVMGLGLLSVCDFSEPVVPDDNLDYRQQMRRFVTDLSLHAKLCSPGFIVIPQNGQELITVDGDTDAELVKDYLRFIDGTGREDLFYGYDNDNTATPADERDYMLAHCDRCEQNGVEVLVIDYCSTHSKMDDSYQKGREHGFISFAAPERDLNVIPDYPQQPFRVNDNDIHTLGDAKNFLYLINPENFASKQEFIDAVSKTDYDLLVMDCFFNDELFTQNELEQLKQKANGGVRLVVSYMSIGEAEDYRYYWQEEWSKNPPEWLERENPDWEGNYKVKYWQPEWQSVIFGSDSSYLDIILNSGFDGVYLDIIDAFEYFENL